MTNISFKRLLLFCITGFLWFHGISQSTIIPFGSTWKYWAKAEAMAPLPEWTGSGAFDETGWLSGLARLGYGGDGEATCIPAGAACAAGCTPPACTKFMTTYFRTSINIADISLFTGFYIRLRRDDGAVIYINGQPVWRSNMPQGTIVYTTPALINVGAPDETATYTSSLIPAYYFTNGTNIIAAELHQNNNASSDVGFDLELISAPPVNANEVVYLWSGALQTTSAKVNAKMSIASTQVRLAVSTNPAMTSPMYGSYTTADEFNNLMAAMSITGLSPATKYYYAVESDGILDASVDDIGTFTTPAAGAISFKFTVGSCALTSNHPVYTRMQEKDPLLALMIGDFHYTNPNSGTDINVHRLPYENSILSITPTRNFFLNYPLAYVWDDHDFSGNDSDSTAAGKTNARLAYREYVPYYPLGAGAVADRPIYQAFTIGRVHFILTDLRSARRTPTIMGTVQKQWFKDQCLFARDNNKIIAWVSGVSFGGNQVDNWGGFTAERTELSNFFRDNAITNMFIMSGDAHMSAIDNGNNHDFASGTPNPNKYPVLAAAAINQSGSYKGGVYSEAGTVILPNGTNNTYPNPNNTFGQYGTVEVTDAGGNQICLKFTLYRVTSTGVESELVNYSFCRTMLSIIAIKMNSFTATATSDKKAALLTWESESETNCRKYQIERSNNGSDFIMIEEVNCRGGSGINRYSFNDTHISSGHNFYRVRSVDQNGNMSLTETKDVFINGGATLSISPNPVTNVLGIHLNDITRNGQAKYVIYNAAMKKILSGNIYLQQGNGKYSIPVHQLQRGFYIIQLELDSQTINDRFMIR